MLSSKANSPPQRGMLMTIHMKINWMGARILLTRGESLGRGGSGKVSMLEEEIAIMWNER